MAVKLLDSLKRIITRPKKQADKELIESFFNRYGYRFSRGELLIKALTHRSYIYFDETTTISNERLEYLGDSVLGLIIAAYLFRKYPDFNEGDLTKAKAVLVNEVTLSQVGEESGLNEFILMSPEEEKSGGRFRSSIISDAMEAVIGALYLDGGIETARKFVEHMIISRSMDIMSDSSQRNYKGELLEHLQSRGEGPPHYEVVSEDGPDHEKIFTVTVKTAGRITGKGSGASKKEAEQQAASESLRTLIEGDEKGIET
jgi:ribonuclease-3